MFPILDIRKLLVYYSTCKGSSFQLLCLTALNSFHESYTWT